MNDSFDAGNPNLSVVPFKPMEVVDAERFKRFFQELVKEYEAGNIREMFFVYYNEKNNCSYGISGNMSLQHIALGIHYIQKDFFDIIGKQGERKDP